MTIDEKLSALFIYMDLFVEYTANVSFGIIGFHTGFYDYKFKELEIDFIECFKQDGVIVPMPTFEEIQSLLTSAKLK